MMGKIDSEDVSHIHKTPPLYNRLINRLAHTLEVSLCFQERTLKNILLVLTLLL